MGKKSKRGNKGKESLKERRERQLEIVDDAAHFGSTAGDESDKWLTGFWPGDWVWFRPSEAATVSYSRGIVVSVEKPSPQNLKHWKVVPVTEDPSDETKHDRVSSFALRPYESMFVADKWPRTLRFEVGDRVLCKYGAGWAPATINDLYPINLFRDDAKIIVYRCRHEGRLPRDDGSLLAVPFDEDTNIMKRVDSLRFSLDDAVIFATSLAVGIKSNQRSSPWLSGRIIGLESIEQERYMGVYEVTFNGRGRNQRCFILKDNDQHVASFTATPRQRFLDSIEQGCDYEHFQYLVATFSLDIMLIRDQVIEQSFRFACYGSLLWLFEAGIDLEDFCRQNGESDFNLRVAQAQPTFAERYFRKLASLSYMLGDEKPDRRLGLKHVSVVSDDKSFVRLQVEPMVEYLVRQRKAQLLSLLFCPVQGLAWELHECNIDGEKLLKLRNLSRNSEHHDIANIIESFIRFRWFRTLSSKILFESSYFWCNENSSVDQALAELECGPPVGRSETSLDIAKALLCFCDRWDGYHSSFDSCLSRPWGFQVLAENGWIESLRLFVEAKEDVLSYYEGPFSRDDAFADTGEFLQPELNIHDGTGSGQYYVDGLSLVEVAVLGKEYSSLDRMDDKSTTARSYWNHLKQYFYSDTALLLVDFFKESQERLRKERKIKLAQYKIKLLSDDDGLENSLAVLDFLVKEKQMPAPSAIDTIRWRRCGILRWLVYGTLINLNGPASGYPQAVQQAQTLQFLGGNSIPSEITLGTLLTFCAIEFDDLQSLLWLVQEQHVDLQAATVYGWNISHACAFFGRSEIAVSLHKLGWLDLKIAAAVCKRKPYQQAFAVHIALEKGFIFVAEVLLKTGSPATDKRGRDIMFYAKRSGRDFVLKYVQSVQRPLILETQIRDLLCILERDQSPYEATKKHLLETRCMDFNEWEDINTWTKPGPLGKSFEEVLNEICCPKDPSFISWFCAEFSGMKVEDYDGEVVCEYDLPGFGRIYYTHRHSARLGVDELWQFAVNEKDEQISKWLENIDKTFRVDDQARVNPVFVKFEKDFPEDSTIQHCLQKLRAKWLKRNILVELRRVKDIKAMDLMIDGESIEMVEAVMEELRHIVKELCKDEDGLQGLGPNSPVYDSRLVENNGSINANLRVPSTVKNTSLGPMLLVGSSKRLGERLFIILAAEGHKELLWWLMGQSNDFDSQKQCHAIRVAAFMGHANIVWHFLSSAEPMEGIPELVHSALLGSLEGGRLNQCKELTSWTQKLGILPSRDAMIEQSDYLDFLDLGLPVSLVLSAVHGCLYTAGTDFQIGQENLLVLKWLHESLHCPSTSLLRAAEELLCDQCYTLLPFSRATHLASFLVEDLKTEWWSVDSLRAITKKLLTNVHYGIKDAELYNEVVRKWLEHMISVGQDIQIQIENYRGDVELHNILSGIRAKQLHHWSQFQLIKDQQSIQAIQDAVGCGKLSLSHRDSGGLLVTHLAAAYDRNDVLAWLAEENQMNIRETDFQGRDVLAVARASNATKAISWITSYQAKSVIAAFVSSRFRGRVERRRLRLLIKSALNLQARFRGSRVRLKFRNRLFSLNESSKRFHVYWDHALIECHRIEKSEQQYRSWEVLKQLRYDFIGPLDLGSIDNEMILDRQEKLNRATESALQEPRDSSIRNDRSYECEEGTESTAAVGSGPGDDSGEAFSFERVKFTKEVEKWLRFADPKYKKIFVGRMKQLSTGTYGDFRYLIYLFYESYMQNSCSQLLFHMSSRRTWTQTGKATGWVQIYHL